MKMNRLLLISLALPAAMALQGCEAKPARAPSIDVQASSEGTNIRTIQSFPRKDIHIARGGNKMLLWKERTVEECPGRAHIPVPQGTRPKLGVCPEDVAFLLKTSNRPVDGLIALDDRTFVVQAEQNRIRALVKSKNIIDADNLPLTLDKFLKTVDTDLPQAQSGLNSLVKQQEAAKAQRAEKQAQLDTELNKPQTEQDPKLIEQLNSDISKLDAKIKQLDTRIAGAQIKVDGYNRVVREVTAAGLDPEIVVYRGKVQERNQISDLSNSVLQEVKDRTDFYDFAEDLEVDFAFQGSAISIDIRGWDFRIHSDPNSPEGDQNFSTADGTITGVSYVELGGTFEFDVHAYDGVYHFKISRARYGALDGLAHFQGEIIRHGFKDTDLRNPRRGVAIFDEQVVDRL